ncbi:DPH4 homolog [Melitaea cinxia]|uniref:DPH4 homolog n=1 Tax=Melitaea cinxia TaxID=113334 RepID=UPI001E272B4C|nr:DPH4 homolog [Melitaea cinxia]
MSELDTFIDYYKVLQCERNSTDDVLKKSYQRLALIYHPDKIEGYDHDENFHRIQRAWSVLRDPQKRRQYDAMLSCYESSDFLLYNTVTLAEMNFDSTDGVYTYVCRCSGVYCLAASELISPKVIINCNECSFSILVNIPEDKFR